MERRGIGKTAREQGLSLPVVYHPTMTAKRPPRLATVVFCDFENVALGVREAKYDRIRHQQGPRAPAPEGQHRGEEGVLRLGPLQGIQGAHAPGSFELIEIPHVRQSGKNSADIRMVVDALDLCYTKSHVDTFVIVSGDSDFSPLVSKLRENDKTVIGVGVKKSTSDLLVAACDEFIYYDDLVREHEGAQAEPASGRRPGRASPNGKKPEKAPRPPAPHAHGGRRGQGAGGASTWC
jgi:uncharacterized LabA/DUF88 family protein